MAFRDDEHAARARAAALQRMLDERDTKLDVQDEALQAARAELAALKKKLAAQDEDAQDEAAGGDRPGPKKKKKKKKRKRKRKRKQRGKAAKRGKGAPGGAPVIVSIIVAAGVMLGGYALLPRVLTPWRCSSICDERGLASVSGEASGGKYGRSSNAYFCVPRDEAGRHVPKAQQGAASKCDTVLLAGWLRFLWFVGAIALAIASFVPVNRLWLRAAGKR